MCVHVLEYQSYRARIRQAPPLLAMWLAARRLLLPCRASALRARPLCTAPVPLVNPLLGVMPAAPLLPAASRGEAARAVVNVKGLPVSPKKLRIVANITRGLYWREALVQLEFCPKKIAIHVKNTIAKAAAHAEEECGLDPTLLVVGTHTAPQRAIASTCACGRCSAAVTRAPHRSRHTHAAPAVPRARHCAQRSPPWARGSTCGNSTTRPRGAPA